MAEQKTNRLQPGSKEIKEKFSRAMQRHHDHYVRAEREGLLSEEDKPNFTLAKLREKDGLVKPLAETSLPE